MISTGALIAMPFARQVSATLPGCSESESVSVYPSPAKMVASSVSRSNSALSMSCGCTGGTSAQTRS